MLINKIKKQIHLAESDGKGAVTHIQMDASDMLDIIASYQLLESSIEKFFHRNEDHECYGIKCAVCLDIHFLEDAYNEAKELLE